MSSEKKRILRVFFLAFVPMILAPALFPKLRLTFFAPFLVLIYYKTPRITSLWLAFCCGLIMDLLTSHHNLGIHTLNYSLTTWMLYNRKQNFFEDNASTLPLMTILFSITSTIIQVVLLHIFGHRFPLSTMWIFTDIIVMPLFDGLYAFIWFTIPLMFLGKLIPRRKKKTRRLVKRPK